MGATARRIWGRGRTSFALLTSLVVLSSFFIVAGVQVASAAGCSQAGAGAGCHLAFRFEDPARSGSYTDTSPHQAGAGQTITNTDLDPSAVLVTVEVEDGLGRRDTSYTGVISITPFTGLNGFTSIPAVAGAASFTLNISNAGYFQLTATVAEAGIAPVTSGTFRIQECVAESGQTCSDSFQNLMNASLTNQGTGTIGLSVGIDGVDVRAGGGGFIPPTTGCGTNTFADPFFHAPAEWTVDEVRATTAATKLVVVRIEKVWRQMVLDKGASSYRPCITALVRFTTWDGSPLTETAPGEFTGLAPDCSRTITYFCRAFAKSNKVGDVLEGISLPSGSIAGDPRGH
jgi:hypothetical protein